MLLILYCRVDEIQNQVAGTDPGFFGVQIERLSFIHIKPHRNTALTLSQFDYLLF